MVVPQPALSSDVITPAVELKTSYAVVLTQSVASKPFDAVKVPPQYLAERVLLPHHEPISSSALTPNIGSRDVSLW